MTSCLTYVRRQQGVPVLSHVVPPNEAHFLVSVPSLVRSNYREQSRKTLDSYQRNVFIYRSHEFSMYNHPSISTIHLITWLVR